MSTFLYYFDSGAPSPPVAPTDLGLQPRIATISISHGSRVVADQVVVFSDAVDSSSILTDASAKSARHRAYFAAFVAMRYFGGHVPHIISLRGDCSAFEVVSRVEVALVDLWVRIVGAPTYQSTKGPASPSGMTTMDGDSDCFSLCDLIGKLEPGTLVSFGPLRELRGNKHFHRRRR